MILGDLVVGWLLMQAAEIATEKLDVIYREADAEGSKARQRALGRENAEVAFYQGKIASAKNFAVNVLPTLEGRCKAIKLGDRLPIEILEESFSA